MYESGLTAGFFSIDGTTDQLTYASDQPNAILNAVVVRTVPTTGSSS